MKHTIALDARPLSAERSGLAYALLDVLAVAGAVALAAQVKLYLPGMLVPLSLQTLPVLLAGFAVGPGRATAGLALYLGMGLSGVPVFTTSVVFGPTFGFLLGFTLAPGIIARFRNPAWGMLAASAAIYICGAIWLKQLTGLPWLAILSTSILPFVPGDLLKATIAYRLIGWARRTA